MLSNNTKAYFLAILTITIWSSNFIIARDVLDILPPFSFAFLRWLLATIIILLFFFKTLIQEYKTIKENIYYLILLSWFGIAGFHGFLYLASHSSTAVNLSLIGASSPILVLVISRFLGDIKLGFYKIVTVFITFLALAILVSDGDIYKLLNFRFRQGDVWMLFASINFAIYNIMMNKRPTSISFKATTISLFILGTIFTIPFFLYELFIVKKTIIISNKSIFAIVYTALLPSIVGYFAWTKALYLIDSVAKVSMIYYLIPIFSAIGSHYILSEAITWVNIFCMVLILFGVILTNHKLIINNLEKSHFNLTK